MFTIFSVLTPFLHDLSVNFIPKLLVRNLSKVVDLLAYFILTLRNFILNFLICTSFYILHAKAFHNNNGQTFRRKRLVNKCVKMLLALVPALYTCCVLFLNTYMLTRIFCGISFMTFCRSFNIFCNYKVYFQIFSNIIIVSSK